MKLPIYRVLLILFLGVIGCTNPFAPKMIDSLGNQILTDQKTTEGVFQNWRYAYEYKDTLVYGRLLGDEFKFYSRDYDQNVDIVWGRSEEMMTTSKLFLSSQDIHLIWNNILTSFGDSLKQEITRSFTLNVMFSSTDAFDVQGRAIVTMQRKDTTSIWQIISWRDESNY